MYITYTYFTCGMCICVLRYSRIESADSPNFSDWLNVSHAPCRSSFKIVWKLFRQFRHIVCTRDDEQKCHFFLREMTFCYNNSPDNGYGWCVKLRRGIQIWEDCPQTQVVGFPHAYHSAWSRWRLVHSAKWHWIHTKKTFASKHWI